MGGCSGDDGVDEDLGLWAEFGCDSFVGELGTPAGVPDTPPAPEERDPAARREGDKEAGKSNGKERIQTSTKKGFYSVPTLPLGRCYK
jgi:hypothetical protein